MTAPENPERILAVALRLSATGRPEMSASTVPLDWWQEELRIRLSRYVREDLAEAEIAEARQARDEEGDMRREIEADRDAVRRERDALLARVEALRSGVLDIRYAAYEVTLRGEGEHPAVVCARVLEADTAAAGKGVG